jgi:hypothetical protein
MTQQSGQFQYGRDEKPSRALDKMSNTAQELGRGAIDRADEWLKPVGLSVKERPMTCLAVVGGLAFTAGALWMLRNSQRQSRMQEVAQQVSDYARRSRFW